MAQERLLSLGRQICRRISKVDLLYLHNVIVYYIHQLYLYNVIVSYIHRHL